LTIYSSVDYKLGELMNMNHSLFIEHVSERTFHGSEDVLMVRITHRWLENILQLLDSMEFGYLAVCVPWVNVNY
jgi:hypothetical protein